jgi:hypothetical protein
LNPDHNPYAPPQAQVANTKPVPRVKPRRIHWAMTALWVAYALTFIHAVIIIGVPSTLWPVEYVVVNQLVFELVLAALIYFVSSGISAAGQMQTFASVRFRDTYAQLR